MNKYNCLFSLFAYCKAWYYKLTKNKKLICQDEPKKDSILFFHQLSQKILKYLFFDKH